jgi:DNA-binding beta-propeller fold protein YncE
MSMREMKMCSMRALVAGGLVALAAASAVLAPSAQAAPGDIFVTDFSAFGGPGGVIRVNAATGARTTVSENSNPVGGPSFGNPFGIAIRPDGQLLVVNLNSFDGTGGVIRVNAATGARKTVSENSAPVGGPSFQEPVGIALESDGGILVADSDAFGGSGGVIRVDPSTGARTTVSSNSSPAGGPDFANPVGIAVQVNGQILVSDEDAFGGPGGVIRVDPVTGTRTAVSENVTPAGGPSFSEPFGIALRGDGGILVADQDAFGGGGGVIGVNPVTGARTTVSANTSPVGEPEFNGPYGLAVDAGGRIIVADPFAAGTGQVLRVNAATGARSALSDNSTPAGGPSFARPAGVAVDLRSSGPPGPPGPPGPNGPNLQGPGGSSTTRQIRLITCKRTTGGKTHRPCVTRLVSVSDTFTIPRRARASLARKGRRYGSGKASGERVKLRMSRRLRPGRYTLTLRYRLHGHPTKARTTIAISGDGRGHSRDLDCPCQ